MDTRRIVSLGVMLGGLCLAPCLGGQSKPEAGSFDLIGWNGGKFVYGVDYYPEAEGPWEEDARMMEAAGINFVRLAEFAWAKMEPSEAKYDFSWLDSALKVLNAHGIRAV